jgi:hypothetical protein
VREKETITLTDYQLRLPEEFANLKCFQHLTFSDGPRRLLEQTIEGRENRFKDWFKNDFVRTFFDQFWKKLRELHRNRDWK